MTVSSAMRLVRARWIAVLVGVLLGVVLAGLASAVTPPRYVATAGVYVGADVRAPATGPDAYGRTLLLERVLASYRELAVSDLVLEPAGRQVGVPLTPGQVVVSATASSAVLRIEATESDPVRAARAANAVATTLPRAIADVERAPGASASPGPRTTVVDRAEPPSAPVAPRTATNLVFGAVLGLVLAAAWVVARGAVDRTVRGPEGLRELTGGVTLGPVPDRTAAGSEAFVDAVRGVRTLVGAARPDGGDRCLRGVLSLVPIERGAGATTLVRALAETVVPSTTVVVVDADLRRPALAEQFGLPQAPGLTDVLDGRTSLGDAVRSCAGVDVLTSGSPTEDPAASACSAELGRVVAQLRERYELVLLDAPPLASAPEAAVLARHTDGAVLVCRDGTTTCEVVTSAVSVLRDVGARTIGSISNGSPPGRRG